MVDPLDILRFLNSDPLLLLVTQTSKDLIKMTQFVFQIMQCPGLTCGINIVKPRFLFKTVDLWSYIMPIDRYSHTL